MPGYIFIFFAGITLTLGLEYYGLGLIKKSNTKNIFFGLFAFASGIYYLLIGVHFFPSLFTLFFASGMFLLFPWYLAYESGFIRKNLLWTITGIGSAYYISALLINFFDLSNFKHLFSYSVYLLTIFYCIGCISHIAKGDKKLFWPFVLISSYYIFFTTEEVLFDLFGSALPWRKFISFTYLDLFPISVVAFKLVLLIRDLLSKPRLEKEVDFYKKNISNILNQSQQFVLSLDLNGTIRFANTYFLEFFNYEKNIIQNNINEYIADGSRKEFFNTVLNSPQKSGKIVSKLKTIKENPSVAWSFVKMKGNSSTDKNNVILLFGADISKQIKVESLLRKTNEDLEFLKNKIQSENIQLKNFIKNDNVMDKLVGSSPNFNYVLNRVDDVANLDVAVLLEGETGVGKEVIANAIHTRSNRKENSFIKVNCAAIPLELMESELFGYEKGAFTGADRLKKGMFELADEGTLFLDEIGDLPLSVQPKLLRALQEGEIQRLGSEKTLKINVRILAATNRSLSDEVKAGNFRSDLFYRINIFPITIPPLRKRKQDIPLLIESFISIFNEKYSKNIQQISEPLMDELLDYSWPGNIRQLRNIIERAVITSSGSVFKLDKALPLNDDPLLKVNPIEQIYSNNLGSLEEFERNHITHILEHCHWKIAGKSGAAEILKLPPSTLRSKMEKLGISLKKKQK